MLKMKYIGDRTSYPVEFRTVSANVVELKGNFPIQTSGFFLSRPDHEDNWNYSTYTTVYRENENSAQFSNDGSIYVEPDPVLTPDLELQEDIYERN